MRLPNADHAIIAEAKLDDYLLNPEHPDGASKARLLRALGYSRADWQGLAADIRAQHLNQDAVEAGQKVFGQFYTITAVLKGPAGSANIMTVWIVERGTDRPRLVTAYRV